MTNNNWEEEFRSIGEGSVRFMATRQEVKQFISNLLTKKDQEHKAELEMIRGELDGNMFVDSNEAGQFRLHSEGYNQGMEDAMSIIDMHINK